MDVAVSTAVRIVAIFAAVFLLLELTARVYLFGIAGLVPAKMNSVHGLNQTGFTRQSDERRIGFELKPNLDEFFKLVPFRTNSRGLRDREYSLEKPADHFRVAVVGSSFTLPAGVEIEQAFHSILEEQLSAEFAPRRFEFINFAVGMHGPEQILAMLELRALPYDPDLILVGVTRLSEPLLLGKPKAVAHPKAMGSMPAFRQSYPVFQSFLARLIEQRVGKEHTPGQHVGALERLVMQAMEPVGPPASVGKGRNTPSPPARSSVLARLNRIQADTGIPIVLVLLEFESTRQATADRLAGTRLPFLDTRDAFRGTRPNDYRVNALDPHPNDRAHAIFARVIGEFLREKQLIPHGLPQASQPHDRSRGKAAPLQ
jgi:hypothetical protein